MVQIGLTAVGTAIGGPLGGAIGSVVGAYADSILLGQLFQPDGPEGPRVEDFRFNQTAEHSPVYKTIGPFNRVPGSYIWLSERQQVKVEEEIGGKGGGGSTIVSYNFFFDMAVNVGEAPAAGISNLLKVWGNSKVLWGFAPGKDVTSDQFVSTTLDEHNPDGDFVRRVMRVKSPAGDPKLHKFKSGVDVTMTDWPTAANNGVFRCVAAGKNNQTGETFLEIADDDGIVVAETAAPNAVNITQGLPQLQANGAADFVFYDGNVAQSPSPLIEAAEGVGLVPAYRFTAYFTFERLLVNQFGNIPPQISALVEEAEQTTDGQAIARLLDDAGWLASEYDISGLGQVPVDGYQVRGPTEVKAQIQPLLVRADVLAQDRSGTLAFFYRRNAPEVVIDSDDLAAHESGRDEARPMEVTDVTGRDLPTTLNLRYLDALFNYQSGSARAQKIDKPFGENVRDINVPVVMLGEDAQSVTRRLLWAAHANQQRVRFTLPPSYLGIQENDRAVVTAFGSTWLVLLERVTRGANYLLECEGTVEVVSLLSIDNSVSDDPTDPEPQGPYVPPELVLGMLDLPPLFEGHAVLSGIYSTVVARDRQAQFIGATVYKGAIQGGNFTKAYDVATEATAGRTLTAHPTPPVTHTRIDHGTALQIDLFEGTLSSKSLAEMLEGANVGVWGKEIISWQDATLIGPNVFELTTLGRGLFDTEDHMVHDNAGEPFAFMNAPGVEFKEVSSLNAGTSKFWKAVAVDGVVSDFGSQPLFFRNETLVPWRVTDIRATKIGNGSMTFTWFRRTRVSQGFLAFDIPVEDLDGLGYDLEILDAPQGVVLRTFSDVLLPTQDYSNSQQNSDFGGVQTTINIAIHKLGLSVQRGNVAYATLTPQIT